MLYISCVRMHLHANPFSEAVFDEKLESFLEVFGIYSVDKI